MSTISSSALWIVAFNAMERGTPFLVERCSSGAFRKARVCNGRPPCFCRVPPPPAAAFAEHNTGGKIVDIGNGTNYYLVFKELAPTLHHDGQVIAEMSGKQESFQGIHAEVLLLGGGKGTGILKTALDSVAKALLQAGRVVFPGLNNSSSWNADPRGNPKLIAQELRHFFLRGLDPPYRDK
jgi:hypothetical protein